MAVEAVVSLVVGKLGDFLIQEAASLYQVRDQVEWVQTELKRMQCFLQDADAKQGGDARVKNWVAEVRDAAYDAEDAIDTFILKIERQKRSGFVRFFKRCTPIELLARREVSSEIERIKNKIQGISASRLTYGIKDLGEGSSSTGESFRRQRQTSPVFGETEVVGFEEDVETLVGRLIEGDSRRCVVSVVGMGGLGKTTLAIKVYNNEKVKKHFDCCAWVSVSQQYVVRDLLERMIKCFKTVTKEELEKVEKMSDVELSEWFFHHLEEKRCLLVLDDVWKTEAWDSFVAVFPDKNTGSRVLITTRNKEVASHVDARPHELRFLTDEEGWELLRMKAFLEPGILYPQNLEKLGREMAAKCCGLPLAIVVIGGLLSIKAVDSNEWEKLVRRISSQLVDDESPVTKILALSYEDLPHHLKPCFLYLGVFPEDDEIRAEKLIQLWVAEGFVKLTQDKTVEEAAEDYLEALIHRSLIQVVKRDSSTGRVKRCRIHDLLRELSISKAKEDKFLDVHNGDTNPLSPSEARRLAIHHASSKCTSLNQANLYLRSVLCVALNSGGIGEKQEELLYRRFNLLRVLYLDLSNGAAKAPKLPKEIGRLIHLRYLGFNIGNFKIIRLPSSISNLRNLETLHAEGSSEVYIPNCIWKMQQLRHVKMPWGTGIIRSKGVRSKIVGRPSLGVDSLVNLQTLKLLEAGDWIEDCLEKLTNLKRLGITGILWSRYAEVLSISLPKLDRLQSLSLEWKDTIPGFLSFSHHQHLKKMYLNGTLEKLPELYEFSPNLTKLTLADSELREDPMATLEKLPNLRILGLYGYSYVGKEMVCSAQGFPQLESLHVVGLRELEEWRVEEGSMPRLLHLLIWECRRLKMLPEGLQHVTTLKKLEAPYMSSEFEARMRENGGEDWYRIKWRESYGACEATLPDDMLM